MANNNLRVGIYVRISKDRAREGVGVRRQERLCRELVATHPGWTVVEVFRDNDISAFSGQKRQGYEGLLQGISSGHIQAVVVWHVDRLYRCIPELERYIDVCKPREVATYSVEGGKMDLTTSEGRMIARTLGNIAVYESEHKGARHRAANLQRAQEGKPFGTRRVFGYEPDGVTIRTTEAEAIQDGAQMIINGSSIASVARMWHERGLISPQGKRRTKEQKEAYDAAVEAAVEAGEPIPLRPPLEPSPWTATSVRTTLRSPRYAGMRTYHGEIVRDPQTGLPVEAAWEPILSKKVWRELQQALAEISKKHSFPSAERQLFSGVAICAVCEAPMMSGGRRNGRRRYRCRGEGGHAYRESAPIDEYVERVTVEACKRTDVRRAFLRPAAPQVDVEALEAELREIDAQEAEMGVLLGKGQIKAHQVAAANEEFARRRREIEAKMPVGTTSAVMRQLLESADVEGCWESLDINARRSVIAAMWIIKVRAPGGKENAYLDWRKRELNPKSIEMIERWKE
ncbi:MAG: recombinase family protein [Actinomyces urogenitalis]|uniref:recombinase family protein n=1 Tax=Actinomyces urogenitalis TaxID=103621 RepID=UPI002A81768A|nr:recombinase family protein [Actinomyces urogenitalis]MDY3678028.1 recombinase family protein [Actinomyces urogenitalis]